MVLPLGDLSVESMLFEVEGLSAEGLHVESLLAADLPVVDLVERLMKFFSTSCSFVVSTTDVDLDLDVLKLVPSPKTKGHVRPSRTF